MAYLQLISSSFSFHKNYFPVNLYRAGSPEFQRSYCSNLPFANSRLCRSCWMRVSMQMDEDRVSMTSNHVKMKVPHVLTVSGSDSGASTGIQADLKACAARGVYCSTIITAVTAQNTGGVQDFFVVPEDCFSKQLKSVLSDMQVDVVKTGMLFSIGTVKILQQHLREFPVRALVVDPVMASSISGDTLGGPAILAGVREELLPMADLVTPNLNETFDLLGVDDLRLHTIQDICNAAKLLHAMGPRNVLIKGGHLPNSLDAVDIFFDGQLFYQLRSPRIKTRKTRGTGCSLASGIAAELAKGSLMLQAIQASKQFVETALRYSTDIVIGNGPECPFDHLCSLKKYIHSSQRHLGFSPSDLFLYAVTDSEMNKRWGRSITDAVKAAIEGGATIVQLREKEAETNDFLQAAKACLKICRFHGVTLLIKDRIDIALACDADGVHVGQSDMPAHVARTILGPGKIIGVSCKTPEQAEQASINGADYISCGGVYPTNTKANNPTVGLDGLKTICLGSKLPVVAIGGINLLNAQSVIEIGVLNLKGVAVVSALFDRVCVLTETKKLHSMLTEAAKRK